METKVVLYGASGHAKVVFEIAKALKLHISGIVDDNPVAFNSFFKQEIFSPSQFDLFDGQLLLSIGNNKVRKKLSLKYPLQYITLIHPHAFISPSSKIGNGTVIMAGVIINAESSIGNHCIINTSAIIEHDCIIEDFAHICPNVSVAGNVKVGEGAQVGIGAKVIQGVKIGKWAIIGAGAVVINDVPDFAKVVGNPGKIIKTNFK
jgi:sugar O-acyltransferase (sialic acid O-acetyltransferase NeuD family)